MRFKLNLLLFVLVTVVFVVSSTFSYFALRSELYARFEARKQEIAKRLQVNMYNALWSFDRAQADNVIDSEINSPDIQEIRIYQIANNTESLWVSRSKQTTNGKQENITASASEVVKVPLLMHSTSLVKPDLWLGYAQIIFTRQPVEKLLANQVRNRVIEVIILNAILALVLFLAMSRKVITPLAQLSHAFKNLAENPQTGGITIQCEDEFGEVVEAFNRIENRLVSDINRRTEVEKKLRQANDDLITAQSQLLQSEKMAAIGQLAAGVAHEINNPIGFVNSNLGTLKIYSGQLLAIIDAYESGIAAKAEQACEEADLNFLREDMPALISESQEGLNRVIKIVQSLKDYSRVNDSGRKLADLNAAMESTLNVVWNELKYKAELIRELGDIPPVDCDPAQINQVFTNLLINAAHAIPEHGKIYVRSRRVDNMVCFEIEDTGTGIPQEIINRIFDPFFTTKPVGKGTGLGLSISYDIVVKKHGGQLKVRSEPGKGSCFSMYLPIKFEEQSQSDA